MHLNQGKESSIFYDMVIDGSQLLGHRDLGVKHQQQFQEPKQLKIIILLKLNNNKKLITLFKRFVFVVIAVASPECLTSNTMSLT